MCTVMCTYRTFGKWLPLSTHLYLSSPPFSALLVSSQWCLGISPEAGLTPHGMT